MSLSDRSTVHTGAEDAEVAEYWRRLEQDDPPGMLVLQFASRGQRPQIAALHLLLAQLGAIPGRSSDPVPALAKLEWWRNQLASGPAQLERHPVSRLLLRAQALDCLQPSDIDRLLESLRWRIEQQAVSSEHQLREQLASWASAWLGLHASVAGRSLAIRQCPVPCAPVVVELLRTTMQGRPVEFWWLPLDWLAEWQISRAELSDLSQHPDAFRMLAAGLTSMAGWDTSALSAPQSSKLESQPPGAAGLGLTQLSGLPHLQAGCTLSRRMLLRLVGTVNAVEWPGQLCSVTLADTWACWRAARR